MTHVFGINHVVDDFSWKLAINSRFKFTRIRLCLPLLSLKFVFIPECQNFQRQREYEVIKTCGVDLSQ